MPSIDTIASSMHSSPTKKCLDFHTIQFNGNTYQIQIYAFDNQGQLQDLNDVSGYASQERVIRQIQKLARSILNESSIIFEKEMIVAKSGMQIDWKENSTISDEQLQRIDQEMQNILFNEPQLSAPYQGKHPEPDEEIKIPQRFTQSEAQNPDEAEDINDIPQNPPVSDERSQEEEIISRDSRKMQLAKIAAKGAWETTKFTAKSTFWIATKLLQGTIYTAQKTSPYIKRAITNVTQKIRGK